MEGGKALRHEMQGLFCFFAAFQTYGKGDVFLRSASFFFFLTFAVPR